MGFELELEPQIWDDLDKALDYYLMKSAIVAEKLNAEFFETLDTIVSNPYYQVRYNNFRSYKLSGFPYAIYYRIEEKKGKVIGFSLVNLYQDSDKYPV